MLPKAPTLVPLEASARAEIIEGVCLFWNYLLVAEGPLARIRLPLGSNSSRRTD